MWALTLSTLFLTPACHEAPEPDPSASPPSSTADSPQTTAATEPQWDDRPLAYWIGELRNEDFEKQIRACEAISYIGPAAGAAKEELLRLVRADDDIAKAVNMRAMDCLRTIGAEKEVVQALVPGFAAENRQMQICLSVLFGKMGSRASAALETLRTAMADAGSTKTDAVLLAAVAGAISRITGSVEETLPALREGLAIGGENWIAFSFTCRTIEDLGPVAVATLPELRSSLAKPGLKTKPGLNALTRVAAARAIWAIGGPYDDSVGVLIAGLEGDADLRHRSTVALGELKDLDARARREAVPILERRLETEKSLVHRAWLAHAAWRLGGSADVAARELSRLALAPAPSFSPAAVMALGEMGGSAPPSVRKLLQDLSEAEDWEVRSAALRALPSVRGGDTSAEDPR